MTALINELLDGDGPAPLVITLHDLHRLTSPVLLAGPDYLLEHLPPHVHLVATTRYDPPLALARLRARAHVAEFRPVQVNFADFPRRPENGFFEATVSPWVTFFRVNART